MPLAYGQSTSRGVVTGRHCNRQCFAAIVSRNTLAPPDQQHEIARQPAGVDQRVFHADHRVETRLRLRIRRREPI